MDLICPGCTSPMARVKDTDIWVDRCTRCGGVFLDKNELNVLATGMSGNIEYCSIDDKKHEDMFPPRSCPVCPDQPMHKADLLVYADTIFDYCPKCEGFYLDKGELAATNRELEELTDDKLPEEYRGYRGDHLVRLDRFNDAVLGAVGLAGVAAHAVPVFYLRLSVYFAKPLELDFRMYSEKWAHKLSTFIGAFKKQDVHTGHAVLDPLFVIQGSDERKVRDLLAGEEIQKALVEFKSAKPRMLTMAGQLEIVDRRAVYTEGPHRKGADANYDVVADPSGIVGRLARLASLFDQQSQRLGTGA
jgi:Zn-finger nucleic acid-binding protein